MPHLKLPKGLVALGWHARRRLLPSNLWHNKIRETLNK